MLANSLTLPTLNILTPLIPDSLLILEHKLDLATLHRIFSTLNIKSRLLPKPMLSGSCLTDLLLIYHNSFSELIVFQPQCLRLVPEIQKLTSSQGHCNWVFHCFCLFFSLDLCIACSVSSFIVLVELLSLQEICFMHCLYFWPCIDHLFTCFVIPFGHADSMKVGSEFVHQILKDVEQCWAYRRGSVCVMSSNVGWLDWIELSTQTFRACLCSITMVPQFTKLIISTILSTNWIGWKLNQISAQGQHWV